MKRIIKVLVICLLVCSNIYLVGKLFFIGNQKEKEQLLNATIWQLSSDGYTQEDILDIIVKYDPMKGGKFPYMVYVFFNDYETKSQIYRWSVDDNGTKSKVTKIE